MDDIKNKPINASKTKKIIYAILFLIIFAIAVVGSILSPNTASADAVSDRYLVDCKFNPMSRAYITFDALEIPNSNLTPVAYVHSFPSALGGYNDILVDNAEAIERHYYNQNNQTNSPTSLNYHLLYANGRETISFSSRFYNAIGNDVINYHIGYVDVMDVYALAFYQWYLPLNLWTIETTLTYRDQNGMLDVGTSSLDVNETITPLPDFPITPRESSSSSWGYVNIAYLLSRCRSSMDVVSTNYINDRDIFSLDITFRLRDTIDTTSRAVVYVNQNIDAMRDFHTGINSYNSLLNYSKDDNISVGSLFQPLEAFLSLEFFDGFTFGYLLLIVLGVSFFTLLIKVLKSS